MSDTNQQIDRLEARLESLVRSQIDFQKEITAIRAEMSRLRSRQRDGSNIEFGIRDPSIPAKPATADTLPPPPPSPKPPVRPQAPDVTPVPTFGYEAKQEGNSKGFDPVGDIFSKHTETAKRDLEKFIGENLISKIGILILIIGVGIGVKYSIDKDLISPTTRVILAYVLAFGLTGLAIKLKAKYHNFSAALLSGGMAIMYFVTYFANAYFGLIPQMPTFALMVMFTILTVAAALFYNRQVIAHIGLVGAYAVPFLLSTDSGNYLALFGYMAVVNAGILAVSVKRIWKPLFYTSSAFTWLIFTAWFAGRYSAESYFDLALVFLGVFFAIFFITKLIHRTAEPNDDNANGISEDLVGILATTFVFYVFCLGVSQSALSVAQTWTAFIYIAVITAAVLAVSFKPFGRPMTWLVTASGWVIYSIWFAERYSHLDHFTAASFFLVLLFAIFYANVLFQRLFTDSFSHIENASLILANSFIFYGLGYAVLEYDGVFSEYLGLYTVAHSALHLGTAYTVSKLKPAATDVVQVLAILVLTFASIAVPVQFDGNIVTMIWAVEAALLFWLGRTRAIRSFEFFSFPVMALAAGSMMLDWIVAYDRRTPHPSEFNNQVFANSDLITAVVVIAAFAFIFYVNRYRENSSALDAVGVKLLGYAVGGFGIFTLYNLFRTEIDNYFHLQGVALRQADATTARMIDNWLMNGLFQMDYTMLFLAAMALVNLRKFRSVSLTVVNAGLGIIALAGFLTAGLTTLHVLGESLIKTGGDLTYVAVRYVSYAIAAALIYALYRYAKSGILNELVSENNLILGFEAVLYTFCFVTASSELIHLTTQLHIPNGMKLGLSILWGIYALLLIVLGIVWKKKHLRIAAIVLLAVTLLKLFFYDMANLDTIPKTILFLSLGVTLLVISFLYNKYKQMIFGNAGSEEEI